METVPSSQSFRSCLEASTGALLTEVGFDSAEKVALETVSELLQSFLHELGRSSRAFCELACRSEPLGADVLLALSEMGHTPIGLKEYALRNNRRTVGAPSPAVAAKQTSILHTGDRKKPAKGAGNAVLEGCPEFPDSHSYIRTPTHKQPIADYESVREKAAAQKRDVERALTRFIAKTCGKTHSLFNTDDTNLFPLISCADSTAARATVQAELLHEAATSAAVASINSGGPLPDAATLEASITLPPYINALMFRDQIFEEDEREYLPKKRRTEVKDEDKDKDDGDDDDEGDSKEKVKEDKSKLNDTSHTEPESIDNPYLRPVRMPRNALPSSAKVKRTT